jgi:hypothetical protein
MVEIAAVAGVLFPPAIRFREKLAIAIHPSISSAPKVSVGSSRVWSFEQNRSPDPAIERTSDRSHF